jgi:hypothetical protein
MAEPNKKSVTEFIAGRLNRQVNSADGSILYWITDSENLYEITKEVTHYCKIESPQQHEQ